MYRTLRSSVVCLLFAGVTAGAAQIVLPAPALERDALVTAIFKTIGQASGRGELKLHWTDVYGRVVEDRVIPLELTDEAEFRFSLDLRRAVAMQNHLQIHFSFAGVSKKGEPDKREEDAEINFVAKPSDRVWWDYQNIMWQDGTADHFHNLRKVGVTAGKSSESSTVLPASLLKDDMRWYVENIATDFYSEYHRYRKDRPYNFALLQAKALYKQDPSSKEGLKRHPSFSDPQWLDKIHDRMVGAAQVYSPYRPLFYNLADESGIAELAGFWDFDFSDHSLDAMRLWLKDRYGSLAALNQQWGSNFASWDLVTPDTTREAMKRGDQNYSSWADHKEWMDIAFASALKAGVDAIHSVDAQAYVGIEGAQMPGWGGYDYARLSTTLDVMEPYDIGDNIEIIRSLNSHLAFVTTSFATGPWERHRMWYELLHGARGNIIWDETNDVVEPDGSIGPRGKDVASYWNELKNGIGALMINSVQQASPIAIHYSQASMRTDWMLTQRPKGDAWMDRLSFTERHDNEFLELRNSYCRLLEDEGFQYKFVAYNQVEQGELLKNGYRVLILPRSTSLSPLEATAIVDYVRRGGVLIVDGDAGTFDEHSRKLPKSSLTDLFNGDTGQGKVIGMSALGYDRQRVTGTEATLHQEMQGLLASAGVRADFKAEDAAGNPRVGVEVHQFRNGEATIVALDNNPPIEVDELGPLKIQSEKRFEKPRNVHLVAPQNLFAYDIRHGKVLGNVKELSLTVDPYDPLLIAFTPAEIPQLRVTVSPRIARGSLSRIAISLDGLSPLETNVLHVDVMDPVGQQVDYYSGNLLAPGGNADKLLPLAQNDLAGQWAVRVKDIVSGQQQTVRFEVF